jgi:hypothetical protein
MIQENLRNYNLGSKIDVVCVWEGGTSMTPLVLDFSAAHFAKRNVNGGGVQKRGRGGRGVWGGEFRRARASGERQRAGGFSKKVRAKCIIRAPKLTLSELIAPLAPTGRRGSLRKAKSALVFAVKSQSSLN